MKQNFASSPVGIVHFTMAAFIDFNLLSGLVNLYIWYTPLLAAIHFYTGLAIIIAPLIALVFLRERKAALKGFLFMAIPRKSLWKAKKYVPFFARIAGCTIFLLVLCNMVTGIMMKIDMLSAATAYNIHTTLFVILLCLIPLHVLLMLTARRLRSRT